MSWALKEKRKSCFFANLTFIIHHPLRDISVCKLRLLAEKTPTSVFIF